MKKPGRQFVLELPKAIKHPDRWVLVAWLLYTGLFLLLSLMQHYAFRTGRDTAIYDHYVWNYSHGEFIRNTIIDASYRWNYYFAPLLAVFVPFYALWSDASILLVLQTVYLSLSVLPIYWHARSQLGSTLAVLVGSLFFIYPALAHVNLIEFHIITLTVPLMALSLYFLLRNRYIPFVVCAFLLLFVKEEGLFAVIGLGLYVLIVARKPALGLTMIAFTAAWFFLLVGYLFPLLMGRDYFFARSHLFGGLGATFPEILQTFIFNPAHVLGYLFSANNLQFLGYLLFPLALLPLAGLDVALIGVPILSQMFLTNTAVLEYQYPSPLIPCVFFATIVGLRRLLTANINWIRLPYVLRIEARRAALALALLVTGIGGYVALSPGPFGAHFDAALIPDFLSAQSSSTHQQWISLVPRDAIVLAQDEALPHFSARSYIYSFPLIPDYRQADYMVAKRGLAVFEFHKQGWEDMLSRGYFQILLDRDGYLVARRKEPDKKQNVLFGTSLNLIGYTAWPPAPWSGGMVARPILTWEATKSIGEHLAFTLQLVDSNGHRWTGQDTEPNDGATPTTTWRVGKEVGDQYTLVLPPTMPTGDYQLTVEVHNASGDYIEAFNARGESLGTSVILDSIRIEKNKQSIPASQLEMGNRLFVDIAEIRFLGYELASQRYTSGDLIPLWLYWRARGKPGGDYAVEVQLRDSTGNIVYSQSSRPAGGTYPTGEWDVGEVLLDWHDIQLPSSLAEGTYEMHVSLNDLRTQTRLGQFALTAVTIARE